MRPKPSILLPAALLLSVLALPGRAATLIGTSVTGSLTFDGDPSNYFDPGYGFIPTGNYLNAAGTTVAISSSVTEFGFDDGSSRISADFSAASFTVNDLIESAGSANPFRMTFTDSALAGQILQLVSGNAHLLDYSLLGNVITVDYAAGSVTAGQTFAAQFTVTPVPEPATLPLLLLAAIPAFAWSRCSRRITAHFSVRE